VPDSLLQRTSVLRGPATRLDAPNEQPLICGMPANVRGEARRRCRIRSLICPPTTDHIVEIYPVVKYNFSRAPFKPSTTIGCDLPERAPVTLTIFNTLDQPVVTLVDAAVEAGHHSITFNAAGLPAGAYPARSRGRAMLLIWRDLTSARSSLDRHVEDGECGSRLPAGIRRQPRALSPRRTAGQ